MARAVKSIETTTPPPPPPPLCAGMIIIKIMGTKGKKKKKTTKLSDQGQVSPHRVKQVGVSKKSMSVW